ncbi:MAG: methylated-DNA--[protein]-cysteine S-methyltransferase, partial [Nitrospinae bacterium]|nr:methylated-DNA--[protein]-cysteine S-methyltransferase [Nitrospinota bacterium]
ERGIIRLVLPGMTEDEIILRLCSGQVSAISHQPSDVSRGKFREIEKSVRRYFTGERGDFIFPIDLSHCTDFQRKVYKVTRNIHYGEVKTYKWIAERLKMPDAARAVGNALSRNPIPLIIPCHRVIRGDGRMGGFTAPGGIDLKMRMLKMEKGIYPDNA